MRKTLMLAASLALWAGPALASHMDPQTFARFPADPPTTTAPVTTAPARTARSDFPMYTPMPAGPAVATKRAPVRKSPFPMYTPMPAGPAQAAASSHG